MKGGGEDEYAKGITERSSPWYNHCQRPSSGLPPLPDLQQRQPYLSLQVQEDDKDDKVNLLSIVERSSAYGGMAFDINFDDNSNGGNKEMPKALQVKVKATNFTREELQAKLDAADQCRKVQSYFHHFAILLNLY